MWRTLLLTLCSNLLLNAKSSQSDSEADEDSGNEQASSGDDAWDAVRHPEYEKIHRRDVDP